MSGREGSNGGEDSLRSIRRSASIGAEDAFRSNRSEGDRLVLTENMTADRHDLPPLVLGGDATASPPEGEVADAAHVPPAAADLDALALRALVADIVREELRGELGAHVTGNIRKLVRREILRAQSLRDAE